MKNKMLFAAAEEAAEGGRTVESESTKLAVAESELETTTCALSREKLQRDEKEAELNKSLEAAHKRGDKLEAELAAVAADAASLRERLLAAQNGAADAAVEAEDLVASKAAEIASLVASLENIKGDLAKRDEDLDTLRDELVYGGDCGETHSRVGTGED